MIPIPPELLKAAAEKCLDDMKMKSSFGEIPSFNTKDFSPNSIERTEDADLASAGDSEVPRFSDGGERFQDTRKDVDDSKASADNVEKHEADGDGVESKKEVGTQDDAGIENDVAEERKTGGTYGELTSSDQWGGHLEDPPPHEVHHMPADSVNGLERNDGPAIVMEKADHRQTASCGNSLEAREYRAKQQELIEQGKFEEAMQMDIDDIHDKFGDKYDDAISQMKQEVQEKGLI